MKKSLNSDLIDDFWYNQELNAISQKKNAGSVCKHLDLWNQIQNGLILTFFSFNMSSPKTSTLEKKIKFAIWIRKKIWYFVTKIVMTYCEKKVF